MTLAGSIRLGLMIALAVILELACRTGLIDRLTMIPPSEMVSALWTILASGSANADIAYTLTNTLAAIVCAVLTGFAAGVVIHALPRLRRVLDPLLTAYYAVPIFAFYPLLVLIFGVTATPIIAIGALFGMVSMLTSTLVGLDRVPPVMDKAATMFGLGPLQALLLIRLPATIPYLITGLKMAVVYSVIAVVAAEFILSPKGLGFRIAFAYNDFDNRTMYGLLLLLITAVTVVALLLRHIEQRIHERWARQ
jgi:NitT/TauT family transport system permease protein